MNAKKVGSFIKEQRQELGLSQKELAEKLMPSWLQRYCRPASFF